jgi:hypothetical protein
MTAWGGVALCLVVSWGPWRWVARKCSHPAPLATLPLLGMGVLAAWMDVLNGLGLRWAAWNLVPLAIAGLLLGVATRRSGHQHFAGSGRGWELAAIMGTSVHAALIAALPSFGWDFRYVWGLKADVFAAAGTHDPSWLSWPAYAFSHPSYLPLWPDLLAISRTLGGQTAASAAAWQALLAAGLAAACWRLARPSRPWIRALAALCGAWPMVIFWPSYSGYAEPLLAFALAATLVAMADSSSSRSVVVVAVGVACLVAAKHEGVALALGVVLAAWKTLPRRLALAATAAFTVVSLSWVGFLVWHAIPTGEYGVSVSRIWGRLVALPGVLPAIVKPKLLVIFLVWGLLSVALRGERLRAIRIVLGVWSAAVIGAYLTRTGDLGWQLATSLDRVLAVPLPVTLALALGTHGSPGRGLTPGVRISSMPVPGTQASAGG